MSVGLTTEQDAAAAVAKWHLELQQIVNSWDGQRQRARAAADEHISKLIAKGLPPTA